MPTVTEKKAKEKIIEAALDLFYFHGFQGTTIRQIAKSAEVNIALVSYYFGGKKGLLEQIMVQFYEGYFNRIEEEEKALALINKEVVISGRVWKVIQSTFDYLFTEYKMTRFIYRELTMDSMLVREVMTIYLSKEKFYYLSILEEAVEKGELDHSDIEMMVLQLLNLLYMPFLQPQVIREVHYMEPLQEEFKKRYLYQLKVWINGSFH